MDLQTRLCLSGMHFFAPGGFQTFLLAYTWLFFGVVVMQEIRETEKRHDSTKRF